MSYAEQRNQLLTNIKAAIREKSFIECYTPGMPGDFMVFSTLGSDPYFIFHKEEMFE